MKIYNEPKRIAINEYEAAISRYIERVSKSSAIHAVLTMGSVGAPGLSDIDIIVVVSDDFPAKESELLSTKSIDDRLFLHGPVVIPISMVSELQFLIYASNLKLLWGSIDVPDFQDLTEEVQRYLSIAYLIDFTESRFQQFAVLNSSGMVDKRAWLTRIWSLTHSYDLLKMVSTKEIPESMNEMITTVKKPREDWLRDKPISESSFLNSLSQAEKLNKKLFSYALDQVWGQPSLKKEFNMWSGQKLMRFGTQETLHYEAKPIRVLHKNIYGFNHYYPTTYLAHLSAYSQSLKVQWSNKPTDNETLAETMRRRFYVVKKHSDWLSNNAQFSGSMSGYTGISTQRVRTIKGLIKHIFIRASLI